MCRLFDPIIGIINLMVPFPIVLLYQLIIDSHWLPRFLGVIGLLVGCTANYIIYYMVSSICPMNKIIVKLLIHIQFEKKHKTPQIKIDSFIARLSKEFVGFYCLFAKFTRKSFYQYIIGISTTYCRTFINANSITVKFDNCKENYWTKIGTNVNQ